MKKLFAATKGVRATFKKEPLPKFNPVRRTKTQTRVALANIDSSNTDPCGVSLTAADICGNKISSTLSGPSSNNDKFSIEIRNKSKKVEIFSATRKPGSYTDAFPTGAIPVNETFTQVVGIYVCNGKTYESPFSYTFTNLGTIHHSQYNLPNESSTDCQGGGLVDACLTDKNCKFTKIKLYNPFRDQAAINGSGHSIKYGWIAHSSCANPPDTCKGTKQQFKQVKEPTGACGTKMDNTTVAAPWQKATKTAPGKWKNPHLKCGTQICILAVGKDKVNLTKTVADKCPGCEATHIDNFVLGGGCTGIPDLGDYVTFSIGM